MLDPVITVHPDEVFFECFSQDESSYGRLGASYEVFENVGEFACGTTNVDYSYALYDEFQKIRSYKTTRFEVDPTGFEVQTGADAAYSEVKIDLPDSWVRGFLQVNSAMSAAGASGWICTRWTCTTSASSCGAGRRRSGPRSMRFRLTPGQPVKVVFEPWNRRSTCPRSIYQGDGHARDPRVGPAAAAHPRAADSRSLGASACTCSAPACRPSRSRTWATCRSRSGLSGWTANDWSTAGNFDLMAPRTEVDEFTRRRVFDALKETWRETPEALAARLGMDRATVLGALGAYTQAGRAIWDLNKGVYRARELSREPLPMEKLRFSNEREEKASRFLEARAVVVQAKPSNVDGSLELRGTVKDGSKVHTPALRLDGDQRMVFGECTCNFFQQNKLFKGPCEHLLALRLQHSKSYRT